jgi:hypothetical protein
MHATKLYEILVLPGLALLAIGLAGCEPKRPPVQWSDTLAGHPPEHAAPHHPGEALTGAVVGTLPFSPITPSRGLTLDVPGT